MNALDDIPLDQNCFSYRDIVGKDRWEAFTPSASLTVVGTPTYTGRYRILGKSVQFQISAVSTTSIASTAGTSYFALPVTAKGLSGMAQMSNDTTNIAVGLCHIDVSTSRCYLPSQVASGNTFTVCGWYEI